MKFLYYLITELWGHMFRSRAGKGKPGASRGYRWEANPPQKRRLRCGANLSSEVCDSGCQEKPLSCDTCPYRKPTQVDEERILRPTEEALLRNSAKWPRNFGIRGAYEGRPQRIGPSNCLAKTQVYAKP